MVYLGSVGYPWNTNHRDRWEGEGHNRSVDEEEPRALAIGGSRVIKKTAKRSFTLRSSEGNKGTSSRGGRVGNSGIAR